MERKWRSRRKKEAGWHATGVGGCAVSVHPKIRHRQDMHVSIQSTKRYTRRAHPTRRSGTRFRVMWTEVDVNVDVNVVDVDVYRHCNHEHPPSLAHLAARQWSAVLLAYHEHNLDDGRRIAHVMILLL